MLFDQPTIRSEIKLLIVNFPNCNLKMLELSHNGNLKVNHPACLS